MAELRPDEIELHETTPIEEVIHSIVHIQFRLHDVDCTPWIEKLRQNLVVDFGLLCRLHPKRLERLELPLLLEDELARRIEMMHELSGMIGHAKKKSRRKGALGAATDGHSAGHGNLKGSAGAVASADKGALLGLSDEMRISIKDSWAIITGRSSNPMTPGGNGSPLNQFFEFVFLHFRQLLSFPKPFPLLGLDSSAA